MVTGKQAGLIRCHECGHLAPVQETGMHPDCRRCGAHLHIRHPDSMQRTWALLIAAIILYIPANLLPITLTTSLGKIEGDTIMQGVIYFIYAGEWPIALVIFAASIMVPLFKIVAMIYLLLSVQRCSPENPLERTKIYRAIEFIGRWSMVDVFVVTVMVALVQLGFLASIKAGSGAVFFCAVVVITMLAAESFDQRLIWDKCGTND